jgi:hydrogenase-4 component F
MTGAVLIEALLLTLLVTSLAAFATRWLGSWTQRSAEAVHLAGLTLALLLAGTIIARVLHRETLYALGDYLFVDSLGAIFLGLIAVVGFLSGVYSIGYMRDGLAKADLDARSLATFYGFFSLFLFAMSVAVLSNNLVLMWVAIEGTTLSSVFLVGIYGTRTSLEAAWKYLVICTVGVALGLYGTVLVFANANAVMAPPGSAMLWTEVMKHATSLDRPTISMAFVFVLIGFGTKAELFPMHGWLPDALSGAPSPASALLSGALANCAMLVIVRHAAIAALAVGPQFPQILLLVFGALSVAVGTLFIAVQRDVKRLLAYSSVENMGMIALGFGLGGPLGVAAALLHAINHSLAKTLLFCGTGNVVIKYGTRDLRLVRGMLKTAPLSGVLLMAGLLAMGGIPPFNVFLSEFFTITAGVKAGYGWLMVVCLIFLTIVLASFARVISGSILGQAPEGMSRGDPSAWTLAPIAVLLALMLAIGLHVPEPMVQLISDATETVLGIAATQTAETALTKETTWLK